MKRDNTWANVHRRASDFYRRRTVGQIINNAILNGRCRNMEPSVKAITNWTVGSSGGCDLSQAIQTKVTHEDVFVKPVFDEVICDDRAVLLTKAADDTDFCELEMHLFPRYKIEAITVVCTSAKMEIFLGPQKEYTETVYGAVISDDDQLDEFAAYRYDFEVQKSGIVDLTLKWLTSTGEICLYGILMQVAPNPDGITTLLPTSINLENVQQMLDSSNQKISPNAEKCKMFMQLYNKSGGSKLPSPLRNTQLNENDLTKLLSHIKLNVDSQPPGTSMGGAGKTIGDLPSIAMLESNIKAHVDLRLKEMEARISERLDVMALEQAAKFDKILNLLEKS